MSKKKNYRLLLSLIGLSLVLGACSDKKDDDMVVIPGYDPNEYIATDKNTDINQFENATEDLINENAIINKDNKDKFTDVLKDEKKLLAANEWFLSNIFESDEQGTYVIVYNENGSKDKLYITDEQKEQIKKFIENNSKGDETATIKLHDDNGKLVIEKDTNKSNLILDKAKDKQTNNREKEMNIEDVFAIFTGDITYKESISFEKELDKEQNIQFIPFAIFELSDKSKVEVRISDDLAKKTLNYKSNPNNTDIKKEDILISQEKAYIYKYKNTLMNVEEYGLGTIDKNNTLIKKEIKKP